MTTIATNPETITDAQLVVTAPEQSSDALLLSDVLVTDVQEQVDTPEKPPCEMKLSIKQEDFLGVLTLVMKAASFHSTLPVLAHVLVATRPRICAGMPAHVLFTCSNQETTISFECEADIECEGTCTIPVKPLLECVKTFSKGKRITVEVQETRIHVWCEKRVFQLKGRMDADAFPQWREMILGDGAPCSLDADVFRQAIKEVHFAAADDETRPVFRTICMHIQDELLTLVALDGYRMAVRTITLPIAVRGCDTVLLAPVASLRLLADVMPAACPVVICWDEARSRAVFQAGLVQIAVRLSEGTFPNYRAVLPKEHMASFTLPRKDLEQIVKAFKPFAQDNANIFTLSYSGEQGTVGCLAESEELGEAYDEIAASIEGDGGRIIFNIRYLMDVLKHVQVDAFSFRLTAESRPGLLLADGREDCFYVVMPMSRNR